MLSEKNFEDIICKYPELIEENLVFKGRQVHVYGKIMDILFEDKFGQKLIIELKAGPIDRKHIGQVMEYEGSVLHVEDPTARVMLVGNRVPPNLKKALDHHGIEWKEISIKCLLEFLTIKNDVDFLKMFDEYAEEKVINERSGEFKPLNYQTIEESSGVWLFQANPKYYRFMDKLKSGNDSDTWRVRRFKSQIKKGDTLFFWLSGEEAGIYAMGTVESNPVLMHADKETVQFTTPAYRKKWSFSTDKCMRIWLKYEQKFVNKPILKEDLINNNILKNLSVIKSPQGTNFRVTKEQWEELKNIGKTKCIF